MSKRRGGGRPEVISGARLRRLQAAGVVIGDAATYLELSPEDAAAWCETEHLLRSPRNALRLLSALERSRRSGSDES